MTTPAIQEFVRAFALEDSPISPSESLGYVRGYAAAVTDLALAAGLDIGDLLAASFAITARKFA